MTFVSGTLLFLGVAPAAGSDDIEIGGPCAGKDYKIIVTDPVSGDKVKVCFDSPEPDPAGSP